MHARHHEIEAQRPEGEVCGEAERLPNCLISLLDSIRADVDVLEFESSLFVRQPAIACDDGRKTV